MSIKRFTAVALVIALAGISMAVQAQYRRDYNLSDQEVEQLLRRIDTRAERFRSRIQSALDQSRLDNTRREDNINQMVADFDQATSRLRDRFNRRQSTASDVREVLERAALIDRFMARRRAFSGAENEWAVLRADLDRLANAYSVAWNWNNISPQNPRGGAAQLTGTFRLNTSVSDDPRLVVERAVGDLQSDQRQRAYDVLLRRIQAPEMLVIERRGRTISLESSHAPQTSFEADGSEHTEQYPNSRRVSRVRATLDGNRLAITSTGDRASDFTVTFEPIGNGRQLRVTRSLYSERLSQPVVVQSTYDQVSEVAEWNVYTGRPVSRTRPASGDYVVPDAIVLTTRLDTNLDTDQTRAGDRFTLTVLSPAEYEGATIDGVVSNVDRGGRITGRTEMALNLESIRLRNGRSYSFEGIIESVRTLNGEDVRIDTEGVVESSNQTSRTIKRSAIGSAIGAVIGAITGGGSGAAIGAAIGAGAGAGSVYVQGRNDLELVSGTELTIRASAPRDVSVR